MTMGCAFDFPQDPCVVLRLLIVTAGHDVPYCHRSLDFVHSSDHHQAGTNGHMLPRVANVGTILRYPVRCFTEVLRKQS